ncbi:HTH domain-containing protein [Niabella sp. CJ426]|uniref:HTH domain-containing protein n=1 Tax=Niabella sp. CJ426 TaxID=3393740 RepID=UPI003CFCFADD
MKKLDQLIARKTTGTPLELSQKLRISERCARQYIEMLRSLGAPIAYSRRDNTYFYTANGSFSFFFTLH